MHRFYYTAAVFLVFGIGCKKAILADEQTRNAARQCDQCEDKLNQYQKEVKQLSNLYNSVRENNIELERRLNSLETKPNSGVSYTRWGRTTCPNSASLVYKGKHYSLFVMPENDSAQFYHNSVICSQCCCIILLKIASEWMHACIITRKSITQPFLRHLNRDCFGNHSQSFPNNGSITLDCTVIKTLLVLKLS